MNEPNDGGGQLNPYWQGHIEAWVASQKSGASYCKEHNLVYHQFNYWRRKFTESKTQKSVVAKQPNGFSRVVMGQIETESPSALTLSLSNGWVIGEISETNVSVVRKLLAFL